MTKSGFDLDEIERLLAAAERGPWQAIGTDPAEGGDWFWIMAQPSHAVRGFTKELGVVNGSQSDPQKQANAALIVALHNSAPAMIAAIRELRAENARLKGHWSALDKALADNIIETDQPHRVRWEGEWHYGPLADAYFAMTSVVRKLARAALGEPQ